MCLLVFIQRITRGHGSSPYHNQETHSDSLADLGEFALVGCIAYNG